MAVRHAIRKLFLWASLLFGSLWLVPIVGEFSVEWARQKGLYDDPAGKVELVMDAWSSFVSSFYFYIPLAFIIGLTAGLYVDYFLKRKEEDALEYTERGFLLGNQMDVTASGRVNARVSVTNRSSITIQNVSAFIERVTIIDNHSENPEQTNFFAQELSEKRLSSSLGKDADDKAIRVVDLHPEQPVSFKVFAAAASGDTVTIWSIKEQKVIGARGESCYVAEHKELPSGRYMIDIVVRGSDVPPARISFKVDTRGPYSIVEVANG